MPMRTDQAQAPRAEEERTKGAGQGKEPQKQLTSSNAIYVGDLSYLATEAELYQMFSTVGQIFSLNIVRKNAAIGKNNCYAYITFFDPGSVNLAIENFNFCKLHGSQIRVMPLDKGLVKERSEANIVVKNLPEDTDNQMLNDTFSIFGAIVSCKVQTNANGECTGVGFIQFEDVGKANLALKMINQTTMKDRKLVATKCIPSDQRVSKKHEIHHIFTNVYIKNFPLALREEQLRRMFEEVGPLTSFYFPVRDNGEAKGYAFANFSSHKDAVRAIEELHGARLPAEQFGEADEPLYVQRAQAKAEREEELSAKFAGFSGDQSPQKRNLYVTNLPHGIGEEEARRFFSNFGKILSVRVATDDKKSMLKAYAYVCFATPEEAASAVEKTQDAEIDGQKIQVSFFKNKRQRELEKISQMYNYTPYSYGTGQRSRKKEHVQDISELGYELYNLILSLAPNYTEKIAEAGFETDEEFASKITGVLLDLGEEEIKKAILLGNVLSQYVEGTLNEIISHRAEAEHSGEREDGQD